MALTFVNIRKSLEDALFLCDPTPIKTQTRVDRQTIGKKEASASEGRSGVGTAAQVKNKKKLEKITHREIFGWTGLRSQPFLCGSCGDTCDGKAPLVSRFTREMEGAPLELSPSWYWRRGGLDSRSDGATNIFGVKTRKRRRGGS